MDKLKQNANPDVPFSSAVLEDSLRYLSAHYPFARVNSAGKSVLGRDLYCVTIGEGDREVLFNAAHHANEWITSLVLLRFLEEYAAAVADGGTLCGLEARALFERTVLVAMPLVNPDGADLVTGAIASGASYEQAYALAQSRPDIPFPSGWKANIRGVDLNLQYPSGWKEARSVKASLGITRPGPRDFVGPIPLSEPESRALWTLTRRHDFSLTLSLHTQGKVIYWKYLDYEVKNASRIAEKFGGLSGYAVEETPAASGYAGYKDWFIAAYGRPGFTIEAGEGISPLPLGQFGEIYADCRPILAHSLWLDAC
jgi:g-D-glutamyl-meso-diaminopimelate peptidase